MRHTANGTLRHVCHQHLLAYMAATGIKQAAFAATVREHYEATFPPELRDVEFSSHPDAHTRMKRDGEKVLGWFTEERTERFPVECLESFIAAFPPTWRFELQQKLMTRQDLLAVPMPKVTPGANSALFGDMMREIGDSIAEVSEMYANGQVGPEDADRAPRAIMQLEEAMAKMASMRALIEREALGMSPTPVILLEDVRRAG